MLPYIYTSVEGFAKRRNKARAVATPLLGFGTANERFVIAPPLADGNSLGLRTGWQSDTITSGWFQAGEFSSLEFDCSGRSDGLALELERRSDGRRWELDRPDRQRLSVERRRYYLRNGGEEQYRVSLVSAVRGASGLQEETLLFPAGEAEMAKETLQQLIDLGSAGTGAPLAMYPNPTNDEMRIALRGEGAAEVVIVNALGNIMWQTEATSGGVLTVLTSDFAAGVYAVRVRRAGLPAAAARFVVAR